MISLVQRCQPEKSILTVRELFRIHYQDWDEMIKNLNYNYPENTSFYNPDKWIKDWMMVLIFSPTQKKDRIPSQPKETITINGQTGVT
jgi:hypothetical protein